MKNTTLAYRTLDYIREHPQEWNQSSFFCGTTACFAGTAVLLHLGLGSQGEFRDYQKELILAGRKGEHVDTEYLARKALGWTEDEARYVFYCFTRDFAELEAHVKAVLNGDPLDD